VKRGKPSSIKIALAYPSTYQASITNLFTHIAYYYLDMFEDVIVDRISLDNPVRSCIYSLNLRKFDVVLFSLSYEIDYVNALRILLQNELPLVSGGRDRPIVIAGGPAAMSNPLPISKFFDAITIGEGEIFLERLVNSLTELPNRMRFLESLGPGVYVPLMHSGERISKVYVSDLDTAFYPTYQIQSLSTEPVYGRGYIMEISRGCPHLCSFCMEAFISYPYRLRSDRRILNYIYEGLKVNKVNKVIFYSLSFFDHRSADKVLEELVENNIKFSIPSLRADTLNEHRVNLIRMGGQKTLTLAPETHSPKLRCVIRKYIDDTHITKIISEGIKLGMNIKMYYIIGIPGEDVGDLRYVIKFLRGLPSDVGGDLRSRVRVIINPLIPKAGTPMQFFGLLRREDYLRRLRLIRSELPRKYYSIEGLDYNLALTQAALSLGNEGLSDVLIKWVLAGGRLSGFKSALMSSGVNVDYVFSGRRPEELPWDFIDIGINVRQLHKYILNCLEDLH